jgi:hypothetical protein
MNYPASQFTMCAYPAFGIGEANWRGFQGTPRNVKQEQQVMGLSSFPVLPRPPAGPHAVEKLHFSSKQRKLGGSKMSRKTQKVVCRAS